MGLPLDADGILCRLPGYVPRQGTHDGRRVAARPRNGGDMPPVREQVEELVHSPVFVDPSGRRRTWVTCALAAAAVVCVGQPAHDPSAGAPSRSSASPSGP